MQFDRGDSMAVLTVRNLPDEVHRALRLRASQNGRSTEAEVRAILESVVKPPERVQLGTLLQEMSRRAGLTNEDVDELERNMARDRTPHEPISFE
jgi:plasmid stability protein